MSVNTSNLRMKKLAAGLSVAVSLIGVQAHAFANVIAVTSCADDDSPGTLRQVIAGAASGDQIDLSGLSCSNNELKLTQGEIAIARDVVLSGGPSRVLTLMSDFGRVLHSTSDNLSVINLGISGGGIYTKSGDAEGGCILADGNLSLTGSVVSDCVASSTISAARGGAIKAQTVSLQSSRISGNAASSTGSYQMARGGGVYTTSLFCTDSTLSGNSATAGATSGFGHGGGALISGANVDLSRCTFDSNVAGEGGAIMQFAHDTPGSTTRIVNSTISGNAATFAVGGVEVFGSKFTPQAVQITNSTLAFNSSPTSYGDGITSNGSVNAQSSIIANNGAVDGSPFADVFATDLTGADNLVMATNLKPARGVVTVSADPMLLPLAYNGGASQTHSMLASSPALRMGNNSNLLATDQRGNGYSRSNNGIVDIGAFQRCQPATILTARRPPVRLRH